MKHQTLIAMMLFTTLTSAYAADEGQPAIEQGDATPFASAEVPASFSVLKLKTSGAASGNDQSYDNTIGVVIEAEYKLISMLGLKLRYVAEEYRAPGILNTFDGSHFGMLVNLYL